MMQAAEARGGGGRSAHGHVAVEGDENGEEYGASVGYKITRPQHWQDVGV